MTNTPPQLLTILGPTACGKTALAVAVARRTGGAIISADSRQVYRGMDIGTGKDLAEYGTGQERVPVYLIDVAEAGTKYNLFEYQRDFLAAYRQVCAQGRQPIVCGGTGLYIESVLGSYRLLPVPQDAELRSRLAGKSLDELARLLASYKTLHNTTDIDSCQRAIRAIEIEEYHRRHPVDERPFPRLASLTVALTLDRELRRSRITRRLHARLQGGMVDEVQRLLQSGIAPDDLIYYGLEYKYVTLYLTGQMDYDPMVEKLETAIHQFAKRQMTWFRGMERRGHTLHWMDAARPIEENTQEILTLMKNYHGS